MAFILNELQQLSGKLFNQHLLLAVGPLGMAGVLYLLRKSNMARFAMAGSSVWLLAQEIPTPVVNIIGTQFDKLTRVIEAVL